MGTRTRHLGTVVAASLALFACDHKDNKRAGDSGVGATPQQTNPSACPADKADACKDARDRLVALQAQRDAAEAKKDGAALSRILIEINHQNDLLRLDMLDEQDAAKYAAVESQYQQLQKLNEAWLAAQAVAKPPVTAPPPPPGTTVVKPALPTSPLAYDPREAYQVARVFQDFGDLYVAESSAQSLTLERQPWAGYWYAYSTTSAYSGDDAPLVKLDRVLNKMNLPDHPADTAAAEAALVPPDFDSSEGHCAAWATAAISSQEPSGPVTYQGETFSVSDQKLLLLKTRELWQTNMYGVSYTGIDTDGIGQDLRPEAWHQLTLTMLGERHQSFYFDEDPGPEVWSVPIAGYRWQITADPENKDAYLVNAQVTVTQFRKDLDGATRDVPTSAADLHEMTYDYRLYVDRTQVKDGKFKVIAGEWIVGAKNPVTGKANDSRLWHPDTATLVEPNGTPKSFNPEFTKSLDIVKQILGQ